MPCELPPLPYAYDALEPVLSADAMRLHHDKHHKAYVDKLNAALEPYPELAARPIEELLRDLDLVPEAVRQDVRNQGGGHANHSLYWECFTPGGSDQVGRRLADAIERRFTSFDKFKAKFEETGVKLFGSGWAWLVADGQGGVEVMGLPNQDSPLTLGKTPILLCDVWEHAYYPDYQNRRPDWLKAWWDIVDWEAVSQRFADARPSDRAGAGADTSGGLSSGEIPG